MRKLLLTLFLFCLLVHPSYAWTFGDYFAQKNNTRQVRNLLESQVRWANKANFDKFINTYDSKYKNADGFDLKTYSDLVKDIWKSYDKIKYCIKIKNISVNGDEARVELTETSSALIPIEETSYDGELYSVAESIYYLRKINGKWKVISDAVTDETTTMLYGQLKDIDIKLTTPNFIEPDSEYTATLEFVPPNETFAIASLASDIVEYPQKQTKEVFRAMPEDNILERLFTANTQNANEYIIASIGLTQTSVCDLSIKLSLTGFGYVIKRVNVIPKGDSIKDDKEL